MALPARMVGRLSPRPRRCRLILSLVAGLAIVPACVAGGMEASTPEQRAGLQTRYMKEHLALDEAQTARVQAINLDYARQMEPVLKGSEGGLARMNKGRSLMSAKDAALKPVLSPQQYEAYEASKDDLKAWLEDQLR